MEFDKVFIARVKKEYPTTTMEQTRSVKRTIRETAKVLNANGRYEDEVEKTISECGYIPVILTLAATIVKRPEDYDGYVVRLARSIPGVDKLDDLCDFHRCYLQDTFLSQTKFNRT